MSYGLIGEKLSHSFSPQIHSLLADYDYRLFELEKENVGKFLKEKNFDGLNVTIPYKQTVIEFCDELSETAAKLHSVNTITINNGKLIGDNTDYYGFSYLLNSNNIDVGGKKCIVLGSGGASKTVCAVLKDLGANVTVISRSGENNYTNIDKNFDAEIIVNTTPVGMYPKNGAAVIDISSFKKCEAAVDLIYNPSKTKFLLDAERNNIKTANGLTMLVAQAKKSCELFLNKKIDDNVIEKIVKQIENSLKNIILIGMPGCGKSSVGKLLSEKLDREFIDTDCEIEKSENKKIPEIFSQTGEEYFRKIETKILEIFSKESGKIIATGGGIVTRKINCDLLKQNSIIIFIDRSIESLSNENRPLSKDKKAIEKLYSERIDLYRGLADITVKNDGEIENVVEEIYENISN